MNIIVLVRKLILRVKKFFKRGEGRFEVWDTSAISSWFDRFTKTVEGGKTRVVLTEGVVHEYSVGRRRHEICKKIYDYINDHRNMLIMHVTLDKMRSWSVDEQIVGVVEHYSRRGYDMTLVTCDRDQAYKAELKGLAVDLLAGYRQEEQITNKTEVIEATVAKTQEENNMKNSEEKPILEEGEVMVTCKKKGKAVFANARDVEAYDKGKKRIGRNGFVEVFITDMIKYKNEYHTIKLIADDYLILKK